MPDVVNVPFGPIMCIYGWLLHVQCGLSTSPWSDCNIRPSGDSFLGAHFLSCHQPGPWNDRQTFCHTIPRSLSVLGDAAAADHDPLKGALLTFLGVVCRVQVPGEAGKEP